MKQEAFHVYSHGDELESGRSLKVERSIFPNGFTLKQELRILLQNYTKEELEVLRKEYKEKESFIFEKVKLQAEEWTGIAKQVEQLNLVLEFLNTSEPEHSNNEWKIEIDGCFVIHSISNKTYCMWFRMNEITKWREGKEIPIAWKVTWSLITNTTTKRVIQIAGQTGKKFTEKEQCEKYIEGRKRAYKEFFEELQPAVVPACAAAFTVNGLLLPGYRVAELGKRKEEKG